MIRSSLNLDFLISPPFVTSNAEDSHLHWYSFRGQVTMTGAGVTRVTFA
jgi:hypothetical protein